MPPSNRSVRALSEETGITVMTLYAWRKQARAAGVVMPGDGKNPEGWSSAEKFRVVLECASLSELELAQYCRRKGLYLEQIAAWREACEQANESASERKRSAREEAKAATKKDRGDLGQRRGRLIVTPDRCNTLALLDDAAAAGAAGSKSARSWG